jgi:hypothetical protein
LACDVCEELKQKLASSKTPDEDKPKLREDLKAHYAFQERQRDCYYDTRAKAVRNRNHDLSIIVDAAGGSGTTHLPRWPNARKGNDELCWRETGHSHEAVDREMDRIQTAIRAAQLGAMSEP